MRNGQRFCATLFVLVSLTAYGAEMNNLGDYQWKNRLILVHAASKTAGAVQTLSDAHVAINDRDIIWFVNTGEGLVSNQATVSGGVEQDINELFAKVRPEDRVLLIGKDGGIKSREPSLDLDAIFGRIDAMPMRMREMRSGD